MDNSLGTIQFFLSNNLNTLPKFKFSYTHFSYSRKARVQVCGLGYASPCSSLVVRPKPEQEKLVTSQTPLQSKSGGNSSNYIQFSEAVWEPVSHDQCQWYPLSRGKVFMLSISSNIIFTEPILWCDFGHRSWLYSILVVLCLSRKLWVIQDILILFFG